MEQPPHKSDPTETSGLAIASIVLGVLGFCSSGLTGIVGLILGIIALVNIGESRGRLGGRGLALAGIIISPISIVVGIASVFLIVIPVLESGYGAAKSTIVTSNLRQIRLAAAMYENDWEDHFVTVDRWDQLLKETGYLGGGRNLLLSPFDPSKGRAVAMNAALDGLTNEQIPDPGKTVVFFESRFGSPLSGGRELLPAQPRSSRGYSVVFVDGHAETLSRDEIDNLVWNPKPAD